MGLAMRAKKKKKKEPHIALNALNKATTVGTRAKGLGLQLCHVKGHCCIS